MLANGDSDGAAALAGGFEDYFHGVAGGCVGWDEDIDLIQAAERWREAGEEDLGFLAADGDGDRIGDAAEGGRGRRTARYYRRAYRAEAGAVDDYYFAAIGWRAGFG